MKIVIAADTYFPHVNGASYSAQRLAYALATAGHEVHVIAPSESLENTEHSTGTVTVHGISSLPVPFYQGFRFVLRPIATWNIRSLLAEIDPEIIHMHMHFAIASSALAYARDFGIPTIATNHFMPDNLVHYLPFGPRLKSHVIHLAWMDAARVYKKTDIVVSPTNTARSILETYLQRPSEVVSNGVPLGHFHGNHDTNAVREKYALGFSPFVLAVGRLDAEKNIDVILRAVAQTKTHFNLIIAGKGALKEELVGLTRTLGIAHRVSFIGFVADADLPALYAAADCFIHAGTAELQGMSVMEAMASGLPIVAARAVALPELVHEGENGYLFEPNDSHTLTQILDYMFRSPGKMRVMGKHSQRIIQPHSIKNMLQAYEQMYVRAKAKYTRTATI
jgi:glycosyltransferase involved in cell wall biosynthesis